jgi:hypothetical protein
VCLYTLEIECILVHYMFCYSAVRNLVVVWMSFPSQCPHLGVKMSKDEERSDQGPVWQRMSRSVSDSTLRHPSSNLTLPITSVTSLMQFKVRKLAVSPVCYWNGE